MTVEKVCIRDSKRRKEEERERWRIGGGGKADRMEVGKGRMCNLQSNLKLNERKRG